MKIRFNVTDGEMTATLNGSRAARDFASLLPLTVTPEDYAGTEKISDLPRKLSTDGAPAGRTPRAGDLAYYAPWGNLALFHRDFSDSPGLIILGRLEGGLETLRQPGKVKVTIEVSKEAP